MTAVAAANFASPVTKALTPIDPTAKILLHVNPPLLTGRCLITEILDCLRETYPDLQIAKNLGNGRFANIFLCEYTQKDGTLGKIALKLPTWSEAAKHSEIYQWSEMRAGGEFLALLVGDDEHVNQTSAALVFNKDTQKFELITAKEFRARYQAPSETPSYQLVGSVSQYHEDAVDLKTYLKNNTLSDEKILSIAEQILRSLVEVHGKGLAHRDIKPANVLFTPDGKIKLIDFGFAVKASRQPLSPRGTPFYYSSDRVFQISVGNLDYDYGDSKKEDIYALGIFLFELATRGKAMCENNHTDWFAYHRACASNMSGLGDHPEIQKLQNLNLKHLITQLGLYRAGLRPSAEEALRYSYFQNP